MTLTAHTTCKCDQTHGHKNTSVPEAHYLPPVALSLPLCIVTESQAALHPPNSEVKNGQIHH